MSKQWNAERLATGIKHLRWILDSTPYPINNKNFQGIMEILDFIYQEMENDGEQSIVASGLSDWHPRYRKE